jgi:hypothetical protein
MDDYNIGFEYISDTAAHAGRFTGSMPLLMP